jgi:hypothetical protein
MRVTSEKTSVVWELPCKSQEFMKLPGLVQDGDKLTLPFDYETDDGYAESSISFLGVEAFSFTFYECCSPDQVGAYDKVITVDNSAWLAELRARKVSDEGVTQHYRIFFDEAGCYDVIAKDFRPPT